MKTCVVVREIWGCVENRKAGRVGGGRGERGGLTDRIRRRQRETERETETEEEKNVCEHTYVRACVCARARVCVTNVRYYNIALDGARPAMALLYR